jgi:hypothetical protein
MITVLAANDFGDDLGDGVAGPVGLLIIALLVVALVFLVRSMNRHLRRVRDEFPDDETVARMRAEALSARGGGRAPRTAASTANADGTVARDRKPRDNAAVDPGGNTGIEGDSETGRR